MTTAEFTAARIALTTEKLNIATERNNLKAEFDAKITQMYADYRAARKELKARLDKVYADYKVLQAELKASKVEATVEETNDLDDLEAETPETEA